MSSVLMNTVNPNRNEYSYFMTVPLTTQNTISMEKTVDNDKKTGNSDILIAGLGGLAVIGCSLLGIKYYKKEKLRKEILGLKTQIKEKYLEAKNLVIENFNKEEKFPEVFDYENFYDMKITSSKDIRKVQQSYEENYVKLHAIQQTCRQSVRDSLTKLSGDKEWQNLHIFRKKLLKHIDGKDINKHDVAIKKIPLVNDMLVYKLHPEKEKEFQVRNLISVDSARYIINKDFANAKEFENEYQKHVQYGFEYLPMDKFFVNYSKLSMLDLFKEEYTTHKEMGMKANFVKVILNEDVPEIQGKFTEKLKLLAQDFRNDETVKTLKNLIEFKRSM